MKKFLLFFVLLLLFVFGSVSLLFTLSVNKTQKQRDELLAFWQHQEEMWQGNPEEGMQVFNDIKDKSVEAVFDIADKTKDELQGVIENPKGSLENQLGFKIEELIDIFK